MFENLNVIRDVAPIAPRKLRIQYESGALITVDIQPLIDRGGVFDALRDWAIFQQAKPDPRGRAVCWPGEIDLCADALWLEFASADPPTIEGEPLSQTIIRERR